MIAAVADFLYTCEPLILNSVPGGTLAHAGLQPHHACSSEGPSPLARPPCMPPHHAARRLASRQGMLDPSASTPGWFADVPGPKLPSSRAVQEPAPPMLKDFEPGVRGHALYHAARSRWYFNHTGRQLDGSDVRCSAALLPGGDA